MRLARHLQRPFYVRVGRLLNDFGHSRSISLGPSLSPCRRVRKTVVAGVVPTSPRPSHIHRIQRQRVVMAFVTGPFVVSRLTICHSNPDVRSGADAKVANQFFGSKKYPRCTPGLVSLVVAYRGLKSSRRRPWRFVDVLHRHRPSIDAPQLSGPSRRVR